MLAVPSSLCLVTLLELVELNTSGWPDFPLLSGAASCPVTKWKQRPESNRRTRGCNPLPSLSATSLSGAASRNRTLVARGVGVTARLLSQQLRHEMVERLGFEPRPPGLRVRYAASYANAL